MTDTAIESSELVVQKGKHQILNKLTFVVEKGTITGLIGPSGSGKTTLMRTIIGVQKSTSGTLKVIGQPAGNKLLRSRIGYVTQSPAVYPDLTVAQNLRYFATLVRADSKNVDKVIEQVQLTKQRNQLAKSLSGGQIARVSLAVALLGNPELLVLDEPTVGLDPLLRNQLWELFAELAKSGKTLLISSHVMDEAERCDNLLLLRDGSLLWNDSREKLLTHSKQKTVGDAFVAMIKNEGAK
jgi:ABC-2 type transport system ATP-binding protein